MTAHRKPFAAFRIGVRVISEGDDNLRGLITSAPAPGMRRIVWDDGDMCDVVIDEIRVEPAS